MSAESLAPVSPAAFDVARSFSGRRWQWRDGGQDAARELARQANISVALAQLLAARGIKANEVAGFLAPTLKQLLPDPSVLKDMDKAVARTRAAIEAGTPIALFGDYDVDGSCAAALLHEFLSAVGLPPRVYIPDRLTEGYGPSARALLQLQAEGAGLVVTVDCGAAAHEALAAARDANLDVIVLDHHAIEHPCPAFAHVNANQPDDHSGLTHLCATAIAFLFAVALNRALREAGWYERRGLAEPDLRAYLDLVGLATVCDVVPLIGLNRAFVRGGLAVLRKRSRPGLSALAVIANMDVAPTPYHLGFVFGPRINAGGRVGRCSLGVELLTAKETEVAEDLARLLDLHNRERRAIEAMILDEAMVMASMQDNALFVLAAKEGWHAGVVGIVASRLKERFARPAFVVGFEGGLGRGSARSVPGVDVGAIVRRARDKGLIAYGGGHAMAAGFSLVAGRLDGFRDFLHGQFAGAGGAIAAAADLFLETAISPAGATAALVEEIALAGPFGAGNPEPLLVVPDVRVAYADIVGKDHVKLRLAGGDGAQLDAIAFRAASGALGQGLLAARGRSIHAAGRLRAEMWNGRMRVQLQLEDAAPAGI